MTRCGRTMKPRSSTGASGRWRPACTRLSFFGRLICHALADADIPPLRWAHLDRSPGAVQRLGAADLVQRPAALVGDHARGCLPAGLALLTAARGHSFVSRRAGLAAFRGGLSAARSV